MPKTFQSGPFSLVRDGDSLSCRLFGAEVYRVALDTLPADGACEVCLPLAAPALAFENDQPVEITHFRIDLTDAARADLLSDETGAVEEVPPADLLSDETGAVEEVPPAPKRRGRRPATTA